jgi:hypothetical protein
MMKIGDLVKLKSNHTHPMSDIKDYGIVCRVYESLTLNKENLCAKGEIRLYAEVYLLGQTKQDALTHKYLNQHRSRRSAQIQLKPAKLGYLQNELEVISAA